MTDKLTLGRIQVGDTMTSSRVTLTDAHIVAFAGLSGDFNPLHMDDTAARAHGYRSRIAHGMLGHSLSTGMRSAIDDWDIVAFLQTQRRFVAPVHPGDTLSYDAQVLDVRESRSGKPFGVVRVEIVLRNQDGETVQQGEDVFAVASGDHHA